MSTTQFIEKSYSISGNGNLVANLDVSAFKSASIEIAGPFSATVTVYGSNTGQTFYPVALLNTFNVINFSANVAGVYSFNTTYRYLTLTVSNYVSGTITTTIELYTQPAYTPQISSVNNPLYVVDAGPGFQLLYNSTLVTAAASGTCSLPGVAGKTTYIRGFAITSLASTGTDAGLVTITGLTTTMNYYYVQTTQTRNIINISFAEEGLPASAQNTAIVLNFPAIVGGAAAALDIWGYAA